MNWGYPSVEYIRVYCFTNSTQQCLNQVPHSLLERTRKATRTPRAQDNGQKSKHCYFKFSHLLYNIKWLVSTMRVEWDEEWSKLYHDINFISFFFFFYCATLIFHRVWYNYFVSLWVLFLFKNRVFMVIMSHFKC